jgi:hypothetical protein
MKRMRRMRAVAGVVQLASGSPLAARSVRSRSQLLFSIEEVAVKER